MSTTDGFALYLSVKPRAPGERGIPKQNVDTIDVMVGGVVGDYNVHRTEQQGGNPDKAVLLLPNETLQDLRREGWRVLPGYLGENITTAGLRPDSFVAGDRYRIGTTPHSPVLEISEPCTPCVNLQALPCIGEARVQEFMRALQGRRGWYARVIREGMVQRYDNIARV